EQHIFAVEIDRRGDQNYVYYNTSTPAFERFVESCAPRWSEEFGSFSDIAVICHDINICGVNLAAGFMHEHTGYELFFLDAWERTRAVIQRMIASEPSRFDLPPRLHSVGLGYDLIDPLECPHDRIVKSISLENTFWCKD